jgi:pimeloyl-ACP methyl ester carboxylesterase
VAEDVLLIPPFWLSERALKAIPGMASSLSRVESRFPVTVFQSPSLIGGPDVPPTWEGAVQALDQHLGPDTHVVAIADGGAVAILALADRSDRARSLVLSGFTPPDETLRSIGLGTMAAASETMTRLTNEAWDVAMLLQGADAAWIRETQAAINAEVNWPYFREFGQSWESIDLVRQRPRVRVPALIQESGEGISGFPEGELVRLLEEILVDFEVESLPTWPLKLHEPNVGLELADSCLAFFERVDSRSNAPTQ